MSEDEDDKAEDPKKKDESWIAIGVALGTGIGLAMGNLALGISLGLLIGIALMESGTPLGGKKD